MTSDFTFTVLLLNFSILNSTKFASLLCPSEEPLAGKNDFRDMYLAERMAVAG